MKERESNATSSNGTFRSCEGRFHVAEKGCFSIRSSEKMMISTADESISFWLTTERKLDAFTTLIPFHEGHFILRYKDMY